MLWRSRPGLVDFTRVSAFATSSFGNLRFKLRLSVEKAVLL